MIARGLMRPGLMRPRPKLEENIRRIGGLMVWVFAVVVSLSVLLGLILLTLYIICIFFCLKRYS